MGFRVWTLKVLSTTGVFAWRLWHVHAGHGVHHLGPVASDAAILIGLRMPASDLLKLLNPKP